MIKNVQIYKHNIFFLLVFLLLFVGMVFAMNKKVEAGYSYNGGEYLLIAGCSGGPGPNCHIGSYCDVGGGNCGGGSGWLFKFTCGGNVGTMGQCTSNEQNLGQGAVRNIFNETGSDQSVQLDVFDHNCRDTGGWSCGSSNLLDFMVWYRPGGGGGGGGSCQCTNGLDNNGNTVSASCGSQICGSDLQYYSCDNGNWNATGTCCGGNCGGGGGGGGGNGMCGQGCSNGSCFDGSTCRNGTCRNPYCITNPGACDGTGCNALISCGGGPKCDLAGSGCAGGSTCKSDGTCSACCTNTGPTAPTNFTTSGGTTHLNKNSITITWTPSSTFGTCCSGQSNQYVIYYKDLGNDQIAGTADDSANSQICYGTNGSCTFTVASWGRSYQASIFANNGCASSASVYTTFTTDYLPTFVGSGYTSTANACNANNFGNYTQTNTNNPVTYYAMFSDLDGVADLKKFSLGFAKAGTYSTPSSTIESGLSTTWGSELDVSTNTFKLFGDGSGTSGNLTNGTYGQLLNLNSTNANGSKVTTTSATGVTVQWNAKLLNSFPNGNLDIYAKVVDGLNLTQTGDAASYIRIDTTRKVDTVAPNPAPSAPQLIPDVSIPTKFSVDWIASDTTTGMKEIRGYCWVDPAAPGTVTITPTSGSPITLGTTEPADTSPSPCATFTGTNGQNVAYTINNAAYMQYLRFKMVAVDNACNQIVVKNVPVPSAVWDLTYGGNAHAAQINFTIPSGIPIDSIFKTNSTTIFANTSGDAFFSTYLSTGLTLPVNYSRSPFGIKSYTDANANPPLTTGNVDYYTYLYNIAQDNIKNGTTAVASIPASQVNGKTTSSAIPTTPVAANAAAHFFVTGNVSFPRGFVCNTKTVIFVDGDITIDPDFTLSGVDNGCILIAKGNISLLNGLTRSSGGENYYDRIDAFMVANGTILTSQDGFDGLGVNGSVIANKLSFNRDLGIVGNLTRPAEGIIYDARYVNIPEFRNVLGLGSFSLREKGYLK